MLFLLNNQLFWKLLVKFQQPWNKNEDFQIGYSPIIFLKSGYSMHLSSFFIYKLTS